MMLSEKPSPATALLFFTALALAFAGPARGGVIEVTPTGTAAFAVQTSYRDGLGFGTEGGTVAYAYDGATAVEPMGDSWGTVFNVPGYDQFQSFYPHHIGVGGFHDGGPGGTDPLVALETFTVSSTALGGILAAADRGDIAIVPGAMEAVLTEIVWEMLGLTPGLPFNTPSPTGAEFDLMDGIYWVEEIGTDDDIWSSLTSLEPFVGEERYLGTFTLGTWDYSQDGSAWGWDVDFVVNPDHTVPGPGTAILLLAGLAGLAWSRRSGG